MVCSIQFSNVNLIFGDGIVFCVAPDFRQSTAVAWDELIV